MKIMFVMLRTLGDVILGTTICREFKKDFPESEIHFYVNQPYDSLLKNNPDIAEIHASQDWSPDMIFMEMAQKDYARIFAPYQIRGECNMWHQYPDTRGQHLVDFYWQRMGMHRRIADREVYLFPSSDDTQKSRTHISMDVPRVAVHSTSNVETKDWPYFNELTEELRKAGYATVQVGARGDKIVKGAIDLRGKMGFLEMAEFIRQCAAFVGLDSGISYMADAVKANTIVIQGSTSPVTSGPISARVIHLFAENTGYADCQTVRCHMNCRHEVNCNTKITVDMVLDKLDPLLSGWNLPISVGV